MPLLYIAIGAFGMLALEVLIVWFALPFVGRQIADSWGC